MYNIHISQRQGFLFGHRTMKLNLTWEDDNDDDDNDGNKYNSKGGHIHEVMFEHLGVDFPHYVLPGQTPRMLWAKLRCRPDWHRACAFKHDSIYLFNKYLSTTDHVLDTVEGIGENSRNTVVSKTAMVPMLMQFFSSQVRHQQTVIPISVIFQLLKSIVRD